MNDSFYKNDACWNCYYYYNYYYCYYYDCSDKGEGLDLEVLDLEISSYVVSFFDDDKMLSPLKFNNPSVDFYEVKVFIGVNLSNINT